LIGLGDAGKEEATGRCFADISVFVSPLAFTLLVALSGTLEG
jgi:hypothetical protein